MQDVLWKILVNSIISHDRHTDGLQVSTHVTEAVHCVTTGGKDSLKLHGISTIFWRPVDYSPNTPLKYPSMISTDEKTIRPTDLLLCAIYNPT